MSLLNTSAPMVDAPQTEPPNETPAPPAAWYRALTLPERITAYALAHIPDPNQSFDRVLAERRLRRWRLQAPLADDVVFARRLALEQIDEERLLLVLGESPETLRERVAAPAWLAALLRAFDRARHDDFILPDELRQRQTSGFLNLAAPLIAQARDRLQAGIQALRLASPDLPFDTDTIEDLLLAGLPSQLIPIIGRTLVLELHVARLQRLLQGDTPEARFQHFVGRLSRPETALAILEEYPVLARALVDCIDRWTQISLEVLQRLCADWDAIRATFAPGADPGVLTALDSGEGDQHQGGRSVLIAVFSSGFRLVYKPKSMAVDLHFQELLAWLNARGSKSMAVDLHFQELLAWLNARGSHSPFRVLKVLDRRTHGWVEFVAGHGCVSQAELRRFYERQGGYLALLYALQSTDFHFENLIAAGEHPVLIDLETLFHPQLGRARPRQRDQQAEHTSQYSVLHVGLLPWRVGAGKDSEGIDIGGLGSMAGQLSLDAFPSWEGSGTDQMHLTRRRLELTGGQNRPTLDGGEVDVLEYAEQIVAGFTAMYQLLQAHRDQLLAADGPLARFADDEVRVILRPTRTYGLLLQESYHPDVLRDALDRDRLFDRLWAGAEQMSDRVELIAAERADLYNGDIPMFTATPGSRDLWNSAHGRIVDVLKEPGLASVWWRIRQLGETDLEQQRWFIRASLATLAMGERSLRHSSGGFVTLAAPADREELLGAAQAIGERLGTLALRGERDATWMGLTYGPGDRWWLAPLGMDLYSGLPGVALFLAYLGSVTGAERPTMLARAALTALRNQLADDPASVPSIGGFDGWGGIIYTLSHLGALWNDPALYAEAEALLKHIPNLLAQDRMFDVIGGAAGCIGGLLSLHHCTASARALAIAVRCGDWLLEHAQPQARGIGWLAPTMATRPLAGFSHGAAGIASVLLELAAASGEARFRAAALDAMAYERTLYSPDAENWPDLREFAAGAQDHASSQTRWMNAWCHGAPGIGLGRLRTLPHLDGEEIRAEIEVALRTTKAEGFGGNHSLCHGDFGNLELLLQAGLTFGDEALREQTYCIAAALLGSVDTHGWQCGVPLGVETPGLMTGLAGIGYGLLRLAEPLCVPPVLVLAPPSARPMRRRAPARPPTSRRRETSPAR